MLICLRGLCLVKKQKQISHIFMIIEAWSSTQEDQMHEIKICSLRAENI
jgi:hypothetical protein